MLTQEQKDAMTPAQIEAYQAKQECGTFEAAAQALGKNKRTVQRNYRRAEEAIKKAQRKGFSTLPVPDGDLSYDELVEYRCRVFERKQAKKQAQKWRSVKFDKAEPTAIVTLGDPHVDDDGCDWPQLLRDTETIVNTPGMYAGSIGDNTNNWIGRLQRLYANQSTTAGQAWKLCEGWLNSLIDPGKLVYLVRGNHDLWSGAGDPHNWIMRGSGAVDQDWQAQIQFEWPKCKPVRMWAAHDFPGNSIYNPLHAHKRKHLWHGGQADVYMAGHRHHWALAHEEDEAGRVVWFCRARGYKAIDSYADVLGHAGQQYGASITTVVNPAAEGVERVQCFAHVQEAADYLTFLRSRN